MANTVKGLAEVYKDHSCQLLLVYKDHSCQLLLVYSPEDMIRNQKAQSFGRMVLAVPALMMSEFVLLSQEVIKLSQGNLLSYFGKDRKQRDQPVVIGDLMITVFWVRYNHRLFQALGNSEQANKELISLVKVGNM